MVLYFAMYRADAQMTEVLQVLYAYMQVTDIFYILVHVWFNMISSLRVLHPCFLPF